MALAHQPHAFAGGGLGGALVASALSLWARDHPEAVGAPRIFPGLVDPTCSSWPSVWAFVGAELASAPGLVALVIGLLILILVAAGKLQLRLELRRAPPRAAKPGVHPRVLAYSHSD